MNRTPGQRSTLRTPDPGLNDRVHLNLGLDPTAILSERLYKLVESARRNGESNHHNVVERIQKDAQGLADGSKRYCAKCGRTRPLKYFFAPALKRA